MISNVSSETGNKVSLLQEAEELRESGDLQGAIKLLRSACDTYPNDAAFFASLSHCYIIEDNLASAETCLMAALELDPQSSNVKTVQARLLLKQQKVSQALDIAKKASQWDPDDIGIKCILGSILRTVGEIDESFRIFSEVLDVNPDCTEALINRGMLFLKRGDQDSAIKDMVEAHKLRPDLEFLWEPIIALEIELGEHNKAVQLANEVLKRKENYKIFGMLGIAFQNMKKFRQSEEAYLRAISISPGYADAYNNLGTVLKEQGKFTQATKIFEQYISLCPNNPTGYNNMGVTLQKQGKLEESLDAFNKAISIRPDYAEVYSNMGNALKEKGQLEEAIGTYTKALSLKPDYADAHFNMGNALKDQGKLEEAIQAYKKSLSLKPDYANTHFNMGNALKKQGKLEAAIDAYTKALSLKPDYAEVKHMLASLNGVTTKTAPREYIENLFDGYANNFEASLVSHLEYKIPKITRETLIKLYPNQPLGSVLDLGCGTGLFGLEIKNYCSELVGIDLSKKMLSFAKQKRIYDKLGHSDIVDYLSSMPLDFDYFIALDVFIYVGNLTEIFQLITTRNRRSAKLVFSTEHTQADGYHILKSGRYSHSKSYVENLCTDYGCTISYFSTINLRKEKGRFLTGGIYILEFLEKI